MSEIAAPPPTADLDRLLELAQWRLSACPAAMRPDLAACLGYVRAIHEADEPETLYMAGLDRHYARALTLASKGLNRHEDRALSLMVMAISELRARTPSSLAQAERTLRQIRLPAADER